MTLTVMTNLPGLADAAHDGVDLRVVPYPSRSGGLLGRLRALSRGLKADYIVVNCSPLDLFEVAALKWLAPFSRCRIVSLDTVLPVPRTASARDRLILSLKKLLFKRVDLFIEYFKDTQGYEQHYGMPRDRFRYVPFKINRYERVLRTTTSDGGYLFCGGNTRRDFKTLIEAVRGLSCPVRIVTMQEAVINGHGSSMDESNLPSNVEVVRHDGSDSFLDHIAAARAVVLPIRKQNISASGIGVYLASMALGKCVIISAGPAVNGVVPEDAAVIVPPEDAAALRAAIESIYRDDAYRGRVAARGRAYALSLGGEARLCESVLGVLLADRGLPARAGLSVETSA